MEERGEKLGVAFMNEEHLPERFGSDLALGPAWQRPQSRCILVRLLERLRYGQTALCRKGTV